MRLSKEIKIDDKTYMCFEVRPKDIIEAYRKSTDDDQLKDIFFDDIMPKLTTATKEEIENMYPSEIEQLVKGVKDCNGPFLLRIKQLTKLKEFQGIVEDIRMTLSASFSETYANLNNQDIVNQNVTDGDFS